MTGGTQVTSDTKMQTADNHTLYAHWTLIEYTIDINKGITVKEGGTSVTDTSFKMTVESNVKITLKDVGYKGFTDIVGVSRDSTSGKLTVDTNASTHSIKGDPITYAVTFNGNGHDSGSTSSMEDMKYDVSRALTANGFSKTGYSFAGWATTAEGAVVYTDGQSVDNLTTTDGATVELFAKWTPNNYTVTFNGNQGTPATQDIQQTYDSNYILPDSEPTRNGYTFAGWFTAAEGGTPITGQTQVKITGPQTLYAHWNTMTYTVTVGTGVTVTIDGQTVMTATFDMTVESDNVIATLKEGYKNIAGAGLTIGDDGKVTITGDYSVTNKNIGATPITYYIEFEGGEGAEGSMERMTMTYNIAQELTQVDFRKEGFVFSNWTDGTNTYANKQSVINLSSTDGATVTLTAQWDYREYTITVTVNDSEFGTVDKKNVSVHHSATIEVDGNKLIVNDPKAGTIIVTATPMADTQQYRYFFVTWGDPTSPVTKDMTITATFGRDTKNYTVFFESDGSVVDQQSVPYGSTADRYDVDKSGYVFLGWYDGESLWNFDTLIVEETHLVAKWEKIESVIVVVDTDDNGNAEVQVPTDGTVEDIVIINEKDSIALTIPAESVPKTEERKIVTQLICLGEDDYEVVVEYEDKESFHGNMIVTLPFDLKKGSPIVYWVVDGTYVQMMTTVDFENGLISFETDHNSEYIVSYVGVPAGEIDNNVLYSTIGIVIAIIAILGVGMYAYRH